MPTPAHKSTSTHKNVDLTSAKKIHILGIGGAGMSAIARILLQQGHSVSGSDLVESKALKQLQAEGAQIFIGHDVGNVSNPDLVTHSTAIDFLNPELEAARAEQIPIYSRAEILQSLCSMKSTLGVAGTHGKTTTSAMLAAVLEPINVSYLIGGEIKGRPDIGESIGAHWDDGQWLVVEADESDGTFLELPVEMAILTSMDPDHIEHYGSKEALTQAYQEFALKCPTVICNIDDPAINLFHKKLKRAISFGTSGSPDYLISEITSSQEGSSATISGGHLKSPINLSLPTPGRHNIFNAVGTFLAGMELGLKPKKIISTLKSFPGVSRRFEMLGQAGGILFIDDYAHLPAEVSETLKTTAGWGRVVCIFQPHRYSRTESLWQEYADSFGDCDILIVTELYTAGEKSREGISAKLIVNAILSSNPRKHIAWLPNQKDILSYLKERLHPGDVCITLNAGDLFLTGQALLKQAQAKQAQAKV